MNDREHRYQLESRRLTGRRVVKVNCPQCGRRRCLVRYVDTREGFSYLADNVGRCDHEQSCGYHYRPGEYFRDNPWVGKEQAWQRGVQWRAPERVAVREPPFVPLHPSIVSRSHSPRSTFWQWLSTEAARRLGATALDVQRVFDDYLIGATRRSDVIFWQVDGRGLVHGGHIMQYGPDGHRLGYQSWVHAVLMRQGLLPQDYVLRQCLFGEHLMARRPTAQVGIVESEKTALVLALRYPQHVWLACGGCGGLSVEKLRALRGRQVTLFPDAGCLTKWEVRMRQLVAEVGFPLDYAIDTQIEGLPANTDLADVLLGPNAEPPAE